MTRTEAAVVLILPSGEIVEEVRDDVSYEYTALLSYRFRPRIGIGATALYAKRRSTIADLGVEGLLLGATVIFTP
jgi:hypothetical protein